MVSARLSQLMNVGGAELAPIHLREIKPQNRGTGVAVVVGAKTKDSRRLSDTWDGYRADQHGFGQLLGLRDGIAGGRPPLDRIVLIVIPSRATIDITLPSDRTCPRTSTTTAAGE